MFGNFIYFIVALLIYSTYQPAEQTNFSPLDSLMLFVSLALFFFIVSRRQFSRIARLAADRAAQGLLDQQFSSALTRQSILAIGLFAVDIYALNLPALITGIALFDAIPTIGALLFLLLFIAYLSMVWANAYDAYRLIYRSRINRNAYVALHRRCD